MHADELRRAVIGVADALKSSDIRVALDRYRAARGEERAPAAARLAHVGAMLMERFASFSAAERRVARLLHLGALGTGEYWRSLLGEPGDNGERVPHQGEIVRLASRVMFASGQLPSLVAMLNNVREDASTERFTSGPDERPLVIRLLDAGERASDPDRIARSIDGVDMLYSACASIAGKPVMDLRLDAIDGRTVRDLHFTGESDSVSAVVAVMESVPAALADIDPDEDIDLEAIIGSLPIFEDLRTLGSLGTFSSGDLKDISETMHQGALLVLESGVVLVEPSTTPPGSGARPAVSDTPTATDTPAVEDAPAVEGAPGAGDLPESPDGASVANGRRTPLDAPPSSPSSGAVEGDEHYERYLREREAMQRPVIGGMFDDVAEQRQRRGAVEELLRSLEQSRNGG